MYHSGQPTVIKKSFLSSLVLGVSAVIVTLILSASGLAFYGINIVDRKTGNVFEFVEEGIRSLPELQESLPPVLADLLNDSRRPDYVDQVEVSVKLAKYSGRKGYLRPVVRVRNTGSEVVSLLSMRVVVLNKNGDPVAELNEWAATPIAAEDEWRGPLMPGATRHFKAGYLFRGYDLDDPNATVEFEITDLRVWNAGHPEQVASADADDLL